MGRCSREQIFSIQYRILEDAKNSSKNDDEHTEQ